MRVITLGLFVLLISLPSGAPGAGVKLVENGRSDFAIDPDQALSVKRVER